MKQTNKREHAKKSNAAARTHLPKGRVGIKAIAKHCGVGITTVSRVLNGRTDVSDEKRSLIQAAIRDLGYVPSAAARAMKSANPYGQPASQTLDIAVQAAVSGSLFFMELLYLASRQAATLGYQFRIQWATEEVYASGAEGALCVAVDTVGDSPAVTLDFFSGRPHVPGVAFDYEPAIHRATRLALGRGYRRPLLVTGDPRRHKIEFSQTMAAGYSRALQEFDLQPEACIAEQQALSKEQGYALGKEVLSAASRPDVVFANDEAAIGILRAARELGLEAPRDFGLVGCNGLSICPYLNPPLATIKVDLELMCREALARLSAVMRGETPPRPLRLLLAAEFVDGPSLGRAPNR